MADTTELETKFAGMAVEEALDNTGAAEDDHAKGTHMAKKAEPQNCP